MQNRSKPVKNDLFEDIEFQEIEENPPEFGEFQQENAFPARIIEWEIPRLGETVKKEAKKFYLRPAAVWIGQAIAHGSVLILSLVFQLVWFFVCIFWMALSGLIMSLGDVLSGHGAFGHGYRHGHTYRTGQKPDIDWRDVPTGWDAKGKAYVRKKMREREQARQRQGHVNNVQVNVNVNIENH